MSRFLLVAIWCLTPATFRPHRKPPVVVILCATGGVMRDHEGAIAFGNDCVLHDHGTARASEAIVVYDATAPGP